MEDFHPQKPKLIEHKPKGGLSITIFSMVMFVLAFTLLFSDQIIFILFLLAVLLIHELGHYLLMKKFNYKHVRMLFIPLMGLTQTKKASQEKKEQKSIDQIFMNSQSLSTVISLFHSRLI